MKNRILLINWIRMKYWGMKIGVLMGKVDAMIRKIVDRMTKEPSPCHQMEFVTDV